MYTSLYIMTTLIVIPVLCGAVPSRVCRGAAFARRGSSRGDPGMADARPPVPPSGQMEPDAVSVFVFMGEARGPPG